MIHSDKDYALTVPKSISSMAIPILATQKGGVDTPGSSQGDQETEDSQSAVFETSCHESDQKASNNHDQSRLSHFPFSFLPLYFPLREDGRLSSCRILQVLTRLTRLFVGLDLSLKDINTQTR